MTSCKKCNQWIGEGSNFCPQCDSNQLLVDVEPKKGSPAFLITLCILTIIGSLFTIIRGYFYELISTVGGNGEYFRGWIYVISGVGTLVGAIIMTQKKRIGLYIYTLFQTAYIVTVFIALFSFMNLFGTLVTNNEVHSPKDPLSNAVNFLAISVALFFLIPAITFLILYWSKSVKNCLQ
jgi:hypothetical protein